MHMIGVGANPPVAMSAAIAGDRIRAVAIRGRRPTSNSHHRVEDLVKLVRLALFGLYLNDIELLRAIEAEQQRAPFTDFHNQQPSLGIHLLNRALVERLNHSIKAMKIE